MLLICHCMCLFRRAPSRGGRSFNFKQLKVAPETPAKLISASVFPQIRFEPTPFADSGLDVGILLVPLLVAVVVALLVPGIPIWNLPLLVWWSSSSFSAFTCSATRGVHGHGKHEEQTWEQPGSTIGAQITLQ